MITSLNKEIQKDQSMPLISFEDDLEENKEHSGEQNSGEGAAYCVKQTLANQCTNVMQSISLFLSVEDIIQLTMSCKRWNNYVTYSNFWKVYCQWSNMPWNIRQNNLNSVETKRLLLSLTYISKLPEKEIPLEGAWSSSEDNQQQIGDTLSEQESIFWSSTGTATAEERDEQLVYTVVGGYALIKSFSFKFFNAVYLQNRIYPCKRVVFESGMSSASIDYRQEFDLNVLISPERSDYTERFTLTKATCARVVKFTLIGKITIQETDNQYYIAIERTHILGHFFPFASSSNEKILHSSQMLSPINLILKNMNSPLGTSEKSLKEEQAKIILSSKDLQYFDKIPELRANEFAFEVFADNQELMREYLRKYVRETRILSELESITILRHKINYRVLAQQLEALFQKAYENNTNPSETMKTQLARLFTQTISMFFQLSNSLYEAELQRFAFFTNSDAIFSSLVDPFLKYFTFTNTDFEHIKADLLHKLAGGHRLPQHPFQSDEFLHYIQTKVLPVCIYQIIDYVFTTYDHTTRPTFKTPPISNPI